MRLGVVSDTHDKLVNVTRIVELFNAARVERVVHTGDITSVRTLEVLAGLDAPLSGVFGNNDVDREALERAAESHGMQLVEPPLTLHWCERSITVVHEPDHLSPALLAEHRIALHGHTHRRVHEERDGTLILNPGECAGLMPGRNAVGVLDLTSLDLEFLNF